MKNFNVIFTTYQIPLAIMKVQALTKANAKLIAQNTLSKKFKNSTIEDILEVQR